ncbi:MAG: OmpP1/FadL family transporter [Vicinamibacteria bacterium]
MKTHSALQKMLALAVVGAFASSPAPVFASGFQLVEQNGSGLGNAFAGQAAGARDASTIFFNPANLTRIEGKQFVLGANPIGVTTTFQDQGSTRPLLGTTPIPVPLGGEGGDAGGWIPVPNAFLSWQAGSQVWVGLGVSVPFGLKTEWEEDWVGRFKATKSEVQTLNINPTLAFKVNESLSVGAGASYQKLKATLAQGVPYGGLAYGGALQAAGPIAAAGILAQLGGPAGLAKEGISQVEGDTWSWGFNLGATLKLGEQGRLAASYRSKIKHDVEGDVTFADAPSFATSGPLGALGTALNARFANGPVTTHIELPETVSIAAAWEGERAEVLADWSWTGWTSIQTLAIARADGSALSSVPLNFEDTWRVGLGFNYLANDAWTLRLGTAYDKAPVQDQYRTPRLPDNGRIWAAGGFQYKLGKKAAIDLGYAHLFIDDATSNLPNQDSPTSTPSGNLIGSYSAGVNIVSFQLKYSF